MSKKTVCISCSHFYPHPGGIETFVNNLSKELNKQDIKVIVLTHDLKTGHPKIEKISDLLIIVRLDAKLLMNGRFPVYKNNKTNKKLFEWINNQDIDYYVVNTRFYSLSNKAVKLAIEAGIKPILIDHGSAHLISNTKAINPLIEMVEHFLTWRLRKYDIAYYGISNASVEWLKHFNIQAKGVIHNAINADEFSNLSSKKNIHKELNIPENDFIVYFVGRYTIEKGVPQLLESAKSLSECKNIHFVFSGKGPYAELIKKYASKYNVYDIGVTPAQDVAAIMKQANVLCLPTRSEGFCTTLLEASACKLPSIITQVGGSAEVIPDNTFGYIIPNTNVAEITEAILKLNENRERLSNMGKNAYSNVKNNYSWKNTVDKLINACKQNNDK